MEIRICEVCKREKECNWCIRCQAWICKECENKPLDRAIAAIKKFFNYE
jgi:hypothetical protein